MQLTCVSGEWPIYVRLKITEVSRAFHSPAPFKAQLLHIMCTVRFQYFPCIVLAFLGNL